MSWTKKVIFICGLIFFGTSSLFLYLRSQYVVPIIMYHSVTPDALAENRLAVLPSTFEKQMRFLKEHGYNVLPLEKVADLVRSREKIPPKTIAITLDDGYKDNFYYAFAILKKYQIPATIFLIVNEIGRPEGDRLNWDQIQAMQDSGLITFGSHTLDHPYLTLIKSQEELIRQIRDSKKILELRLGRSADAFSYPAGRFNEKIRQLVIDSGYKFAVVSNPGKEFPDDDVFRLKRLRISSNADNLFVFWVETSGYYNFMRENRHK